MFVGQAQERLAGGWRGFQNRGDQRHSKGHPHFVYRRQSLMVDHWYFYLLDPEWGPAFR